MKFLVSFVIGLVLGVGAALVGVYMGPLGAQNDDVPIKMDDSSLQLAFDGHLSGALVHLHSGLERLPQVPADLEALWNPAHRGNHALVHALTNDANEVVAYGVKFGAWSEQARVFPPAAIFESNWQVIAPELGSFFVAQRENYWPLMRAAIIPAAKDGEWRGNFIGDTTVGPRGTLEGEFIGASGVLRGQRGVASESIAAKALALASQHTTGTVTHTLTIVPDAIVEQSTDDAAPAASSPLLSER